MTRGLALTAQEGSGEAVEGVGRVPWHEVLAARHDVQVERRHLLLGQLRARPRLAAILAAVDQQHRLAEEKIGRAEAQAVEEVRAAAVDSAVAAAEKILKTKVSAEVGSGLADRSIRDLKGLLN